MLEGVVVRIIRFQIKIPPNFPSTTTLTPIFRLWNHVPLPALGKIAFFCNVFLGCLGGGAPQKYLETDYKITRFCKGRETVHEPRTVLYP